MIDLADLYELVEYDNVTGIFTWRKSHGFNKKGKPLSSIVITLNGKRYTPGKLAWFYTHGRWPGIHFAYLDGNRNNIALSNLTNKKIYQRRKPIPMDAHIVAIQHDKCGWRVVETVKRKVVDWGVVEDYATAQDIQEWILCSNSTIET